MNFELHVNLIRRVAYTILVNRITISQTSKGNTDWFGKLGVQDFRGKITVRNQEFQLLGLKLQRNENVYVTITVESQFKQL